MTVILNPNAGGDADTTRQAIRLYPDAELVQPENLVDGAEAAARAGATLVVAAGGDGTVHAVANGLMRVGASASDRPTLGVLPMGTGNDLARTLAIPFGAVTADVLDLLANGERRPLDAILVNCGSETGCYAVNACSGGFTTQIDDAVTPGLKKAWGPLAYTIGTLKTLPAISDFHTTIAWDDEPPERVHAFNVLVANGRTIGGGTPVAPHASLESGCLDVTVVREGGLFDIARLTAKAYATEDYTEDVKVIHRQVRKVSIASTPGMWFNVDGEMHTQEPVTFEIVPHALNVVVGPEYVAVPA